ncbi:MAG: DMT family transporter [Bryobacteraceae bacterium]
MSVSPPAEVGARLPARWPADLALAFISLIWGATFFIVKDALLDISTVYFLTLRFALASLCMAPVLVVAFRKTDARSVWRGLGGGAVCGVFLWLGYILQTAGLRDTTPSRSAFLTCLYIVLVPPIAAAIERRKPKWGELAGLAVAAAGMFVLTAPRSGAFAEINRGDLLTIGCAFAFALQIVVVGFYSQREAFQPVAFGQVASAAVLSGISLLWEAPRAVWTGRVVFAVLVTGILATALAFALQTWAQQRTTTTRAALIFALEPVFALVTAAVFAGESPGASALAGCALILAGILLVECKLAGRR